MIDNSNKKSVIPLHPKSLWDLDELKVVRHDAFKAEKQGYLSENQFNLIVKNRWLRIMMPKVLGGSEISVPQILNLLESFAWADGSFGWVLNLLAGANYFTGFITPEVIKSCLRDPKFCIAGSGAIGGTAEFEKGVYRINGKWKYASGSKHATMLSFNASITSIEVIQSTDNKETIFKSFLIPVNKAVINKTWNALGMKASSSHEFEIHEAIIAEEFSFDIGNGSYYPSIPLYSYPVEKFFLVNISVVMSGIAIHFIDLFIEMQTHKFAKSQFTPIQQSFIELKILEASESFYVIRTAFFLKVNDTWVGHLKGDLDVSDKSLGLLCRQLSRMALTVCSSLYQLGGMDVIAENTEINRAWRDLYTASQHKLLSPLMDVEEF